MIIFIIGTGICIAPEPPKYLYRGSPASSAAALATAIETAKVAFAPSRALLSLPSKSIKVRSKKACSEASKPMTDSAISVLILSTAFKTPLPIYRPCSPSRNSTASREPVDAPEGTAARPIIPDSSNTSHSTVGFPRESRISRPIISTIALICISQKYNFLQSTPTTQKYVQSSSQDASLIDQFLLRFLIKPSSVLGERHWGHRTLLEQGLDASP